MRVLIDTNVVLDYMQNREPFASDAEFILGKCFEKKLYGGIAAHSITNIFYILRKAKMPVDACRTNLKLICSLLEVVGISKADVFSVLDNRKFDDIEDCLQNECAKNFRADCIITRNLKDFSGSDILCLEPREFIKKNLGRVD